MRIFILILFYSPQLFAQLNNNQCPCSTVGIDQKWADSNKVSCYQIPVNKDYRNVKKGKFYLSVVVAKALQPSDKSLLYLHGGPGIGTIENVKRYVGLRSFKAFRENHSLVFFDYRGTGKSQPAFCKSLHDSLNYISKIKLSLSDRIQKTTSYYKNCKQELERNEIDNTTFSSKQLAADAEEIRKTLQIKTWKIYGVSYGTTVALNMLRHHKNIDAVILDSPFPPNAPWLDYVRPFDTCFSVLEKAISHDPLVSKLFSNMRLDFVSTVNRLNKSPVILPLQLKMDTAVTSYKFDGNDFAWSIWAAMLSPRSIPFVPMAIKEIASGNDSALITWAKLFNDPNAFGLFSAAQSNAILCYEGQPRNAEEQETALLKNYPLFASFINPGLNEAICNVWRPQVVEPDYFNPVVSKVPVLIVAGEFDPVCPPYFGKVTAKTLSNSTFIEVPAASHAAIGIDSCVLNIASTFLNKPVNRLKTACVEKRNKLVFVKDNLVDALNKAFL